MNIHIIIHESFEAPGAIETWANNNNYPITYTKLYEGDKFPKSCDGFDYLIVMGGPQSPDTTTEECPHFYAKSESDFIKKAIDENKLVLGVCLGAQLIGEALGAKYDHSPNREIGVFEVKLTKEAVNDPIFSSFPKSFNVGHWHGDMPGLTSSSEVLLTSEGCPRQVVKYSPKVYGFQCHFEFNLEAIDGMIDNSTDELKEYKDLPYVETADVLRSHDYDEMNSLLFKFLDHMKNIHLDNER